MFNFTIIQLDIGCDLHRIIYRELPNNFWEKWKKWEYYDEIYYSCSSFDREMKAYYQPIIIINS